MNEAQRFMDHSRDDNDHIRLSNIAQRDQTHAAMDDIARVIGGYYTSLVKHGTPHDVAMQLVCEYQMIVFEMDNHGA